MTFTRGLMLMLTVSLVITETPTKPTTLQKHNDLYRETDNDYERPEKDLRFSTLKALYNTHCGSGAVMPNMTSCTPPCYYTLPKNKRVCLPCLGPCTQGTDESDRDCILYCNSGIFSSANNDSQFHNTIVIVAGIAALTILVLGGACLAYLCWKNQKKQPGIQTGEQKPEKQDFSAQVAPLQPNYANEADGDNHVLISVDPDPSSGSLPPSLIALPGSRMPSQEDPSCSTMPSSATSQLGSMLLLAPDEDSTMQTYVTNSNGTGSISFPTL